MCVSLCPHFILFVFFVLKVSLLFTDGEYKDLPYMRFNTKIHMFNAALFEVIKDVKHE